MNKRGGVDRAVELKTGVRIGRYRIERRISREKATAIYHAKDTVLGRDVAIKLLTVTDPDAIGRFLRRARFASIINHPNICTVYDIGKHDGLPFMVMELLEGKTLAERIIAGSLPHHELLAYGVQAAAALECAHATDVTHGALGFSNILVTADGRVKVINFGETRAEVAPESDTHALATGIQETLERIPHPELFAGGSGWDWEECLQDAARLRVALERLCAELSLCPQAHAPKPSRSWLWKWPAAAVSAGALTALGVWAAVSQPGLYADADNTVNEGSRRGATRITPLTTLPGWTGEPALSPCGDRVAFAWFRDGKNIYIQDIGGGGRPLTTGEAHDQHPAWSPDGRYIAFLRRGEDDNERHLMRVPSTGGEAERLLSGELRGGLTWSPNGQRILFAKRDTDNAPWAIHQLAVETGKQSQLTFPPAGAMGDRWPAYSPDRQILAFARSLHPNMADIYLISPEGERQQRLTIDGKPITGLTWTPGGESIIYAKGWDQRRLFRASLTDGETTPMMANREGLYYPAASPRGGRLLYMEDPHKWQVVRKDLTEGGRYESLSSLTSSDYHPRLCPEGRRIAFGSYRSGNPEIWMAEADGGNARQLTNFDGPFTGSPRWAPAGDRIAFDSRAGGAANVYVVDVAGSEPQQLTHGNTANVLPSWSRDAKWFYFASNRTGEFQVWRKPVTGGTATQVTHQGGYEAFESLDGAMVYYTKSRSGGGLWQVPVDGGEERLVGNALTNVIPRQWSLTTDGVYILSRAADPRRVDRFDIQAREVQTVHQCDWLNYFSPPGWDIAANGEWAIGVVRKRPSPPSNTVYLVENVL